MAKTPLRKSPGDYHHGNLRRALLDAAIAILGESGPESFTLREAARRVGVDHRAAYRHFADRDAVLATVAEEGYRALVVDARRELEEAPENDPPARLLAMAHAYTSFAVRDPARYRVMTGPRLNEEGRFPEMEAPLEEAFRLLREEIRAGVARGVFAEVDEIEAALTLWAAMHGLASLVVMRRIKVKRERLAAFTERAIGTTVRGMLARPR